MKITYQTQKYDLAKPITVQELLKQEIQSSKYKVVGCIFNNEYQNLEYEIQTDRKKSKTELRKSTKICRKNGLSLQKS